MAPAYELFCFDKTGNEEPLGTLITDLLVVSDDESRAQAEEFIRRHHGDEGVGKWHQSGAKVREVRL